METTKAGRKKEETAQEWRSLRELASRLGREMSQTGRVRFED